MLDQKKWFMSKTVWGVLLMLASSTLATFGINLDAASQAQIAELIMQAITVGGGALAVYGRVTAKTKLK